ncbi:hypothetical protein EK904_006974, partial [Melospiza melodia maxima]
MCCHRQREGPAGPGPESSARGPGRAGVGRAVVQAQRSCREATESGPGHVECPVRGLLAHCSDCGSFLVSAAVTGQVALEQHPREVTVREGDGVTFQCSLERGSALGYNMYWYRQGPGGSLKFIYKEGEIFGEGFQDRFVGSVERFSFTLQLLAATPGDAAIYYCGAQTTLEQLCSR